jgi:hypothetical protein
MLKYLGSNPTSIATTVFGMVIVLVPLIEQYQKGTLSPWMLVVGAAGAAFARLTDDDWVGSVKRIKR